VRGEYNTRQKRELLGFMQEHSLENFSVDDVVLRMQNRGAKVGRSTVYRYLEYLAEQGSVRKYQNVHGITQYQHYEDNSACSHHFHMMCKMCGTLRHVDCDHIQSLAGHIAAEHGFTLDPKETVLVGICSECAGRSNGEDQNGVDHAEKCHDCI